MPGSGPGSRQGENQPSLALHGVAGVHRHVDQGRLELAHVSAHEAGVARHLDDDLDARPCHCVEHLAHSAQPGAHLEHLRLQRLPPGECQELAGQPRGAVDRVGHRFDVAQPARLEKARATQEVHGGADDGQQVVEIVRHAAGELADGLQPLALPQGLLGLLQGLRLLPLRLDVTADGIDAAVPGPGGPGDPAIAAVLVAVAVVEAQERLAVLQARNTLHRALEIAGMEEIEEIAPEEFRFGPAEHRLPGRVGGGDRSVEARDEHDRA